MTQQYLDMVKHVLENGEQRGDRTGTGTIGVFGYQTRFNLSKGFPLLTTKDMENLFPKIFHELMWFIKGETNIKYLVDRGVNIWNADAYRWFKEQVATVRDFAPKEYVHLSKKQYIDKIKSDSCFAEKFGDLGRIYGKQWTDFGGNILTIEYEHEGITSNITGINQLKEVIEEIKRNPTSRRLIISAWNPIDQKGMALPPCHVLVQFYVTNDDRLSCQLYQRSGDLFLGVPFNIASYALFTHMIAHMCDLGVGEFIHTFGDLHIYNNHVEQMKEQLNREPLPLPTLEVLVSKGWVEDITAFELDDFELIEYEGHGKLTGEVSVG